MPELFIIICTFILGLCFGSFANVVIYRWPRKVSIVKPPSACGSCGKRLAGRDMVPVISWLILKKRCRFCRSRISRRYPLVELSCGLLFAGMAVYSPTLSAVPLAALAFVFLTVSVIDWDTQEIPDGLIIVGAMAGVAYVAGGHFLPDWFPYSPVWWGALLGIVAGAVPLLVIDRLTILILKKDGFGYGDVKLMAMVGLFLGWQMTLIAFFFAFVSGAVFAVYLMVSGKSKRGSYMAFGPFLCIGSLIVLWFGDGMLSWYLGLLAY